MATIDYTFRQANGDDLNFIYSTWLDSFHDDSCFGRMSFNRMFYNFYRHVIDLILSKPDTKVLVATVKEEPLVILSFLVFEPKVIHYVYTKMPFRRLGLASSLIQKAFNPFRTLYFTHQTRMVRDVILNHRELIYKDMFIFKGEENAARTETQSAS